MRNRRPTTLFLTLLVLSPALVVAQAPPSASALLETAEAQAASTKRSIFVTFHASW
jgi:hypothetical protein